MTVQPAALAAWSPSMSAWRFSAKRMLRPSSSSLSDEGRLSSCQSPQMNALPIRASYALVIFFRRLAAGGHPELEKSVYAPD